MTPSESVVRVHICTGGLKEWFAITLDCPRCWHRHTWFGYTQMWYGSRKCCGHCGVLVDEEGYWRAGPPAADRARALSYRQGFAQWLIEGSPKIDYSLA